MYSVGFRKSVERDFQKLAKKNRRQLEIILNKIEEIRENPHRYKNLRKPLQHLKRVHIDRSFVLVFSIDEEKEMIIIEDFDHHDRIYKI